MCVCVCVCAFVPEDLVLWVCVADKCNLSFFSLKLHSKESEHPVQGKHVRRICSMGVSRSGGLY